MGRLFVFHGSERGISTHFFPIRFLKALSLVRGKNVAPILARADIGVLHHLSARVADRLCHQVEASTSLPVPRLLMDLFDGSNWSLKEYDEVLFLHHAVLHHSMELVIVVGQCVS